MRTLAFLTLLGLSASPAAALSLTTMTSTTTIHEQPTDWQTAQLSGLLIEDGQVSVPMGIGSGTLVSAPLTVPEFDELVPSWNTVTGEGGSLTLEVRVQQGENWNQWSRWYSFGTWSAARGRGSAEGQKDAFGEVQTDVLKLRGKASTLQYRLTLSGAGTRLGLLALNTSQRSARMLSQGAVSNQSAWGKVLNVPQRSQMLYPGGGEVWCSPTSVSMILESYGKNVTVPQAADGIQDAVYDGTGNWAFNAAYAGELGLRSFITRLPSLSAAEQYIAAGVPLVVSISWKKGELPGAFLSSSTGHLMVLVGFDANGNPVLNDPAGPSDTQVRRVYPRAAFERLWLSHSGGLTYVMTPQGTPLPQ